MNSQRENENGRKESCGNAGAVESVESQKQASPSFHEPLGNLAEDGGDSHIPTAPATAPMFRAKPTERPRGFAPGLRIRV
jgi:hypothetical protein